jgi:hypothetical protein
VYGENMRINIGGQTPVWKEVDELREYYNQHKNELRRYKTRTGSTCKLLSNYNGWCTIVLDATGALCCTWAGELIAMEQKI